MKSKVGHCPPTHGMQQFEEDGPVGGHCRGRWWVTSQVDDIRL